PRALPPLPTRRSSDLVQIGYLRLDPFRDGLVGRERQTQGVASDRVTTHPHQELELSLRHPIIHRDLTIAERGNTRPQPLTGRRRSEEHTSELQSRFDL